MTCPPTQGAPLPSPRCIKLRNTPAPTSMLTASLLQVLGTHTSLLSSMPQISVSFTEGEMVAKSLPQHTQLDHTEVLGAAEGSTVSAVPSATCAARDHALEREE